MTNKLNEYLPGWEGGVEALWEIIKDIPGRPSSGDVLRALVRAEEAGFQRGLRAAAAASRPAD